MEILAATTEAIDEQFNTNLADQKRNNRQIFLKILKNWRFLSRQGLQCKVITILEISYNSCYLKQGTALMFKNSWRDKLMSSLIQQLKTNA